MGVVDAINALNQPAQKLIDTVSAAIGKVYEPRHIRKMADAEAYRINTVSEAMRNNCDLPIEYNSQDGTTAIDISDFNQLIQRTGARLAYQEVMKQQNIENVIDKAYTELEKETQVSEEPVSEDWINRFFNSVEDISDDDMQKLFGMILADEIRHPNTYSLRTLNVLRNLSKSEAELFVKIAPLVFHGLILSDGELLTKYGVSYVDIIKLDDCGLVSSKNSSNNLKVEKNCVVLNTKEHLIFAKNEKDSAFSLKMGVYVLTPAGNELLKVVDSSKTESLMCDMARVIQNENKDVHISLHRITEIEDDGLKYDTTDLLKKCETNE